LINGEEGDAFCAIFAYSLLVSFKIPSPFWY